MTSVVTTTGTVTFYKLSPHHIHVYMNSARKAVINSVEPINCLCVEVWDPDYGDPSDVWTLWMGSTIGRVYCVDSLSLQTSGVKDWSDDNQDIFDTLLASQLPSQHGKGAKQRPVSNIVRVFPSDSKLLLSAPVVSIGTGQGLLCVCTLTNSIIGNSYTISLHHTKALSTCSTNDDNVDPLWTKHIPAEGLEYMGFRTMETANNLRPLPVVYLVTSSSLRPSKDENSGCALALFSALFGSESAVIDATVLIFGSPSGVVFYFKLKDLNPNDKPEVLCALNQPIIAIHTLAIPCNGRGETPLTDFSFLGSSQAENQPPVMCLAVIGQNGKCSLIFQSGDTLQYQTVILPGPIVSEFALSTFVYVSTDKDLHRCRFSCVEREDRKKKFEVSVSSLGFSGICGIDGEPGLTLGSVELYLFSRHGRLYTVTDEGEGSERKTVAATQTRDLLLSIGNTSHEMDRVKEVIATQNDVLSQLALATKLAALTAGSATEKAAKLRKLNKIVKVKVSVKQDCLGSRREFSVHAKLTNESVADLSSDWLMLVQVDHFQDIKGEITLSNFSKSLPLLKGLRPECFEEIQIPLEGMQLKTPSLAVRTFLVYNVPQTGFDKVMNAKAEQFLTYCLKSSQDSKSVLCIPLQEDRLNILDFLHVPDLYQSKTSQTSSRSHHSLSNSEMCSCDMIALELARQRPTYGLYFPSRDSHTQTTIRSVPSVVVNLQASEVPKLKKCRNSTEVLQLILSQTALGSANTGETTLIRVSTPRGHQEMTSESRQDGDVQEKQIRSLLHTYQGIRKSVEGLEMPRPTDDSKDNDVKNSYSAVYEQLRNVPLPHT
ncbi:uncharacterized protein LOC135461317 isoform X2 [Liolophura sinensis]|uniref:uncharacterized protein LOC135461317 isoform X2 n=1 Tax=Liolophura sinensis TaxID=3198878 RepID=UPI003158DE9C